MDADEVYKVLDKRLTEHEKKCDERQTNLHSKIDDNTKDINTKLDNLQKHVYYGQGIIVTVVVLVQVAAVVWAGQ